MYVFIVTDPTHHYRLKDDYLPTVLFKLTTSVPATATTTTAAETASSRTKVKSISVVDDELYVTFLLGCRKVFVYKTSEINAALNRISEYRRTFAYTRSRIHEDCNIAKKVEGEMCPIRVLSNFDLPRFAYIDNIEVYKSNQTRSLQLSYKGGKFLVLKSF